MRWFERLIANALRLAFAGMGIDVYTIRDLREQLNHIEKFVIDVAGRPSPAARTYEVGYDEHGNGVVRSEPLPRADAHRAANFAVGHDNARNGRRS